MELKFTWEILVRFLTTFFVIELKRFLILKSWCMKDVILFSVFLNAKSFRKRGYFMFTFQVCNLAVKASRMGTLPWKYLRENSVLK